MTRAFDQWGKPEQCYRTPLAAEKAAPQEVRRGAVRDLAAGLLRDTARTSPTAPDPAARPTDQQQTAPQDRDCAAQLR